MSRSQRQLRRHQPRQIIIARGDDVRVVTLRGWMVAAAAVAAVGITFWLAASTTYVVFRDDVLAAMITRQTRMQHAYEDRIAGLRLQMDRVTSRQLIDQEAFTGRMDELMRRQTALDGRAQAVQGVLDRARQAGLMPQAAPAVVAGVDPVVTGSLPRATRAPERAPQIQAALDDVDGALRRMGDAQEQALARVEARTRDGENRIRTAVAEIGISPEALAGPRPRPAVSGAPPVRGGASGGPFLPLAAAQLPAEAMIEARSQALRDGIDYLERMRRGLQNLPLRRPIREPETSSSFGARRDPFLGTWANHSGIDYRGEHGEPVMTAAAGTVLVAGRQGAYGLMVEVDHGNGLTTRYAHMSAILVRPGQRVVPGQQVGRVGSTGRSTGPHLHYETRIEGEYISPERYIRVGQRLDMW